MKHRLAPLAIAAALILLTGCGSSTPSSDTGASSDTGSSSGSQKTEETQAPPAEPLNLTGEWKQTNSNSPTSYQAATITTDQITINWVNEEDSSTALYWAGTYVAPTEDVDVYTWESANDTTQTDSAMLASSDPTKTFTYEDGALEYELTAMGVTMTVEMSKQ